METTRKIDKIYLYKTSSSWFISQTYQLILKVHWYKSNSNHVKSLSNCVKCFFPNEKLMFNMLWTFSARKQIQLTSITRKQEINDIWLYLCVFVIYLFDMVCSAGLDWTKIFISGNWNICLNLRKAECWMH